MGRSFISPGSLEQLDSADQQLPQHGKIFEELQSMIGEHPFSTFVSGETSRRFVGGQYSDGETTPLADFPGFENPAVLASELVDSFTSLPWEYTLTVKLPSEFRRLFADDRTAIAVCPTIRICLGSEFQHQFSPAPNPTFTWLPPLGSLLELSQWEEDAAYFQMQCHGYVTAAGTETAFQARDAFLSFVGLLIALRLIRPPTIFDEFLRDGRETSVLCRFHAGDDGWWQHVTSLPVMEWNATRLQTLQPMLHGNTSPRLWFESTVKRIGLAFSSDHGERLRRAAKWLFDSYCGSDSLQQFVQAAVAIEILLGDEEAPKDMGLTELMANRCAYLIGKTPEGRADLLKKFPEIYRVRSKIVHTGKSRLSGSERKFFLDLQSLCAQVIDEELHLIVRSSR